MIFICIFIKWFLLWVGQWRNGGDSCPGDAYSPVEETKSEMMMIKFGKYSKRSVGAGGGAEGGDFTCLRQWNKVTFELVLEKRIVLLAENGEEGKVYSNHREQHIQRWKTKHSPQEMETFTALECGKQGSL